MKSLAAIVLTLVSSVLPAWAVLGQGQDSIQADAQTLKGKLATTQMSGYSVEQITRGDGAVLKEFVSPDGKVFGLSWRGPTMPNLSQLLGPYFLSFQQGNTQPRRRGPISVHTGPLVVETGGHQRMFHVRALLSDQFPNGVSEDVVQ